MTFLGVTEHFSGKNGALRWSILVGKQKHNVQKPICGAGTRDEPLRTSAGEAILIHVLQRSRIWLFLFLTYDDYTLCFTLPTLLCRMFGGLTLVHFLFVFYFSGIY